MFGRTFRIALLVVMSQLSSGCFCCCERPLFWRKYQGGGCCEQPCTTCCGSPATNYMPPPPMSHGMPVYSGAPIALPAGPQAPVVAPPVDRMQPISSTALSR